MLLKMSHILLTKFWIDGVERFERELYWCFYIFLSCYIWNKIWLKRFRIINENRKNKNSKIKKLSEGGKTPGEIQYELRNTYTDKGANKFVIDLVAKILDYELVENDDPYDKATYDPRRDGFVRTFFGMECLKKYVE